MTVTPRRMSRGLWNDVGDLTDSIGTWRGSLIKNSSFAVRILVAKQPGSNFADADSFLTGNSLVDEPKGRDLDWFLDNVAGKERICLESGMDSHEAVRTWPGLLKDLDGAFPWGGGIIDLHYGLIVCTSGFKELEDVFVSRTVRNFIVMRWDMDGEQHLEDARKRGARQGGAAADRFTRPTRLVITEEGLVITEEDLEGDSGIRGAWVDPREGDHIG